MKKIMLMQLLLIGASGAYAYQYPYLTIETVSGEAQNIAVEELVLTFSGGKLVATNGDGMQSFVITDLSKMFFTSSSTAVEQTVSAVQQEQQVEVYTVGGLFVGRFDTMALASQAMKQGIYVVRQNGQSKKITVK